VTNTVRITQRNCGRMFYTYARRLKRFEQAFAKAEGSGDLVMDFEESSKSLLAAAYLCGNRDVLPKPSQFPRRMQGSFENEWQLWAVALLRFRVDLLEILNWLGTMPPDRRSGLVADAENVLYEAENQCWRNSHSAYEAWPPPYGARPLTARQIRLKRDQLDAREQALIDQRWVGRK